MKINEILIENYLCYFGIKKIKIADGLNIVLGENGEGKTKFFEALEWLFKGDSSNLEQYVSAKALSERSINETFKVRVSITATQFNEIKILSRYFTVKKNSETSCSVSNLTLEGIQETIKGERTFVNGDELLQQLFPSQIRKYSMFKGEEELNIFDNEEALINLINLFSDAKYYDKYQLRSAFLRNASEKAMEAETRKNKKIAKEYEIIIANISDVKRLLSNAETFYDVAKENIEKTKNNIKGAEKHIDNAEALEVLNKRIASIENKLSHSKTLIDENYTTALFDENWMLVKFESIQKEFSTKISDFSKKKRELQSKYDREIGEMEGERKAKLSLLKGVIPLPVGTPSKAIMEEMLKAEVCKVCNREAKIGSEAYEFMILRLNEYIEDQNEKLNEEPTYEKLFKFNYLNRLISLNTRNEDELKSVKNIKPQIKEMFRFNEARMVEIQNLEEQLDKEIAEREIIIGNSSEGSERLGIVLKDYNLWQADLGKLKEDELLRSQEIKRLEKELDKFNKEKEKIDVSNVKSFLVKTRNIIRDIDIIFKDIKESKFSEFIELLSEKSNDIFSKINVDAFTGVIVFKLYKAGNKNRVKIRLEENNGQIVYKPNQSLMTSMHISILMAISNLTKEARDESFPLIFDAPTSSFGESKTTEFLNLIFESGNQIIILLKDYIGKNDSGNLFIKPDFDNVKKDKSLWVKLQRPFDSQSLKTINAEILEV